MRPGFLTPVVTSQFTTGEEDSVSKSGQFMVRITERHRLPWSIGAGTRRRPCCRKSIYPCFHKSTPISGGQGVCELSICLKSMLAVRLCSRARNLLSLPPPLLTQVDSPLETRTALSKSGRCMVHVIEGRKGPGGSRGASASAPAGTPVAKSQFTTGDEDCVSKSGRFMAHVIERHIIERIGRHTITEIQIKERHMIERRTGPGVSRGALASAPADNPPP